VLLVHASGRLDVFIEPELMESVAKFLLHLPGVRLFAPSARQSLDKDLCELLKVNWFVDTLSSAKSEGVLLGTQDKGSKKNIEQWPIMQSYGQAELGKGFFSLDHQVEDLTAAVNQLYKNYDGFGLKQLINQTSERLASHVFNSFLLVTSIKFLKRPLITEKQVPYY